jgi:FSR family fosmidomycin resistance protein-like MFS transporter
MKLLLDALFSSVALGHMIVDVMNGQRAVLLTYWSAELGLTNTTYAAITTLYVCVASLSQPLFGWISDQYGRSRLMAAGGILWMSGFFSLALFLPVHFAIPCLILASLGSAAFHPAGTMHATMRGRTKLSHRETTAASWFFLFGQGGYFLGPIIGGPLLDIYGPIGLIILPIVAVPIGLNAVWQLREFLPHPKTSYNAGKFHLAGSRRFIVALAVVGGLQAWAQSNMGTFIPKYLSDMGETAAVYGLFVGLFSGGSAIGNVIGGNLADRLGKQRVAMMMLMLATFPIYAISQIGWSPWLYILVPLSGAFTGAVHSIVVVLALRALPTGMATASGLTLGFMFSAGAIGSLLCGPLADAYGIPAVFAFTALLTLAASLTTLLLREEESGTLPVVAD